MPTGGMGIVGQKPPLVCNRFPPTVQLLPDGKGNLAMHSAFPTVNPDMVCGEFEVFLPSFGDMQNQFMAQKPHQDKLDDFETEEPKL